MIIRDKLLVPALVWSNDINNYWWLQWFYLVLNIITNYILAYLHFKGSQPEWCISSMMYSGDTPFWSETLICNCKTRCRFTGNLYYMLVFCSRAGRESATRTCGVLLKYRSCSPFLSFSPAWCCNQILIFFQSVHLLCSTLPSTLWGHHHGVWMVNLHSHTQVIF